MWDKILKYRELAKSLHRVEFRSGKTTSFWHDSWSLLGHIDKSLGVRGCIDIGIPTNATVAEVIRGHRRRRKHKQSMLNNSEEEIEGADQNLTIIRKMLLSGGIRMTTSKISFHRRKLDISSVKSRLGAIGLKVFGFRMQLPNTLFLGLRCITIFLRET